MKKILITGDHSYIGTSFQNYIKENYSEAYIIDTVDMIDGSWCLKSFAEYDSVFHVAGIAHQKETRNNAHQYYRVNRDLAVETARKSKADGVKQIVFLSSMSVYGMDTGVITRDTTPNPKSHYGMSKWQAEQEMASLSDENFAVCILRPPMVYGHGCKGNYQTLVKLAEILPVLPNYANRRSMVSIDRLAEYVKQCIDTNAAGIFVPQNEDYVCTSEMIMQIRRDMGKRFIAVKMLNPFIKLCVKCTTKGRKAFGDLIYKDIDQLSEKEK